MLQTSGAVVFDTRKDDVDSRLPGDIPILYQGINKRLKTNAENRLASGCTGELLNLRGGTSPSIYIHALAHSKRIEIALWHWNPSRFRDRTQWIACVMSLLMISLRQSGSFMN